MASTKRKHRRNRAHTCSLSLAATLLLQDMKREADQYEENRAYHAPSECDARITPHNPDKVLRTVGRSVKWFIRSCKRRGITVKWLYRHSLPY